MRIAVNAIFLQEQLEGFGHYVWELLQRMAKQHPDDEFLLVFDRKPPARFLQLPNTSHIVVGPPARHPTLFWWWYDVTAANAVKKHKPDVWWQPYGFLSRTTKIPQVLVLHDLAFLHYPQFISAAHRSYYRFFTPRFLKKATQVITVSDFSKNDILSHYPVPAEKISVIPNAARPGFEPMNWQDKEMVKAGYADGREYFLFTGGIHPRKNLMNLLKAFSLFKKWQRSNMKLLVAGRLAWQYEEVLEKLKSYKYRADVVLLDYVPDEQLVKLTAAAYALVYPSFFEGFGLPVLEAMQAGVPVITSSQSAMLELAAEAALYAAPDQPDAIAQQLLKLYRDEALRNRMVDAGLQRAQLFNWEDAAASTYDVLRTAAKT
jgi:glycosyltransferase involved in cell wall biosynthesis